MNSTQDIVVNDQGTIVMFSPQTEFGRNWLKENTRSESWQWLGDALAVDHRMAQDIIEGMQADGIIIG